jgi:hypothetical protein
MSKPQAKLEEVSALESAISVRHTANAVLLHTYSVVVSLSAAYNITGKDACLVAAIFFQRSAAQGLAIMAPCFQASQVNDNSAFSDTQVSLLEKAVQEFHTRKAEKEFEAIK